MRQLFRALALTAAAAGILVFPLGAGAGHATDPHTPNLVPRGHILEPASLVNPAIGNPDVHTDMAFWGKFAIQGNFDGFNIRDIRDPDSPKQVGRAFCEGGQGDVVVYKNIVVRTWDAPASGTTMCGGQPVPAGFEGIHVFDISDKKAPKLLGSVDLECGTHTATGVPDKKNKRLLIYSSNSNTPCPWIDIIEVPLKDPGAAKWLRSEPSDHTCHDFGVILGDAMKGACAGGMGVRVFSLGGKNGGSLVDPELLFHVEEPGVTIGHSAAWTWDGKVIIFGHEPGGGVAPECEATDDPLKRTYFFYDGDDRREARPVDDDEDAVGDRELHAAQPEHDPAEERPRRARARELPVGDERGRLHRPRRTRWSSRGPTRRRSSRRTSAARGRRTGTTTSSTRRTSPRA